MLNQIVWNTREKELKWQELALASKYCVFDRETVGGGGGSD